MHADNPLLFEFIRAAHDPDPVHAARLRPFASTSDRRPPVPVQTKSAARFDTTNVTALLRNTVIATLLGIVPVHRTAPAPCC
jgi:hypothetical protein